MEKTLGILTVNCYQQSKRPIIRICIIKLL